MRRSKGLLVAAFVAAHAALPMEVAHADRRSGLGGNILIEDPDDLFAFPQLTLAHRNMVRLDYGATSTSGNGVLTLGNDQEALAVSVHRGDLLSPDVVGFNQELVWLGGVAASPRFGRSSYGELVGPEAVGVAARNVLPATVLDLSYARAVGRNPLGIRVGFGRGVQAVRVDDGDEVTKGAQTFFAAQLGYSSLPIDGMRWDASANVVFAFGKSSEDGFDQNKAWDLRLGALARGYRPINQLVDVGFVGGVSLDNEHSRDQTIDDDSNDFAFDAMAGVGPSIHLERAKIAAYGGLRLGLGKSEPSGDAEGDEQSRLRLAAPMFSLAAEVQVLDWLFVRTGAQYTWQLTRVATDEAAERVGDGAFLWSAGLGLQKGGFSFDGVVQNGFVTGGPNFIGGNADGFLAIASLTYAFGDVFGSATTSTARPMARPVVQAPAPPPVLVDPAPPEQELAPPLPPPAPAPPPAAASPSSGRQRGANVRGNVKIER